MDFIRDKQTKFLIQLIIGIFIFCYIAHRLNWVFIYLSLALYLAYFFGPLYRFIVIEKKISKWIAILMVFTIIILATVLVIFYLLPNALNELNILSREIPNLISRYQDYLLSFGPLLEKIIDPENLKNILGSTFSEIQNELLSFSRTAILQLSTFLTNFSFGMIMVPLILYYLLTDMDLFKDNLLIFVSKENKQDFREIVTEIDRILSKFIRGRLIVCFIVGVLITVGLYLLQINFYLIIGIVSGILNFIPYLGPIVGWAISAFFIIGKPWWFILLLTILFVGINQIEALWLDPKILGKELGLHPLTIILSILIFGSLLGFLGVLFAVPIMATLKVIVYRYLVQEEKTT